MENAFLLCVPVIFFDSYFGRSNYIILYYIYLLNTVGVVLCVKKKSTSVRARKTASWVHSRAFLYLKKHRALFSQRTREYHLQTSRIKSTVKPRIKLNHNINIPKDTPICQALKLHPYCAGISIPSFSLSVDR